MSNFNSADIAAFKDVWVFCEQREGKLMPTDLELISKGRDLANELGVELHTNEFGDIYCSEGTYFLFEDGVKCPFCSDME